MYGFRGANSSCGLMTNCGFLYAFGLSSMLTLSKSNRSIGRRVTGAFREAAICDSSKIVLY